MMEPRFRFVVPVHLPVVAENVRVERLPRTFMSEEPLLVIGTIGESEGATEEEARGLIPAVIRLHEMSQRVNAQS